MKRRFSYITLTFLLTTAFLSGNAQSWLPVGFGLPERAFYFSDLATTSDSVNLFVGASYYNSSPGPKTEIFKWNGLFWQVLEFDNFSFGITSVR